LIAISLKRIGLEQDFAVLKIVVILMSTWHEQPVQQIERLEQTSKPSLRLTNSLREPKNYCLNFIILLLKLLLDREHLYEHLNALVNSLVN
jgi:hypothetical protein